MKTFRTLSLITLLSIFTAQSSKGAIAALWAIWNPAVATSIAIYGLAAPVVGYVAFPLLVRQPGNRVAGLILGGLIGVVILDEDGIPSLHKLNQIEAMKYSLSNEELLSFNNEIEEINILVEEVSNQINKNSDFNEVSSTWSQYDGIISRASRSALSKIANFHLKKL